MGLVELIITLVIVGVLLYLVEKYVPMDAGIKKLLQIVVIIIVVLWLLQSFGILGHISPGTVDKIHVN